VSAIGSLSIVVTDCDELGIGPGPASRREHRIRAAQKAKVREAGVEPAHPKALGPKPSVSTVPPLALVPSVTS
jgi:hypothetical protein